MADLRRRAKTALRWLFAAAVVTYAVGDRDDSEIHEPAQPSEQSAGPELSITSISDADVNPGDAIVVGFDGAEGDQPITAQIAMQPAEIVVRRPSSVVVRIPPEVGVGKAGMRLAQGERRSKSWDLHIRPANHKKLVGRLLGGLALFIYGLGLLASGLRGLAGQRARTWLRLLTRSPQQAIGVGLLVGASTQLTSSAAAFTVGLVEARLLALGPSIAILVGAQLGAALTGALLPVAFAREGLLVIAIGVVWIRLSTGRQAHAAAHLVLGAGLMLYGLHLLQTSVEPLVSDPKLLPYVDQLRDHSVVAWLRCAGVGALLALLLQGPGPVYVLVLGFVHRTDALPLANALALLAGTSVGAAVAMAIIVWQSGPSTRPLARPHMLFGACATSLGLVLAPLIARVAGASDANLAGSAMATGLAIGFVVSQLLVVSAWLAVLPTLIRHVKRRPDLDEIAPPLNPDTVVLATRRDLARSLSQQRKAIEIALETSCAGDRARTAESEEALLEARRGLESRYAAVTSAKVSAEVEAVTHTVVACLQLQRVVEQLVHVADLGVERGLRLLADEQAKLREMHEIAAESFDATIAALERGSESDLEAAEAREIRMNQLEIAGRTTAISSRKNDSSSLRLGIAELADSYEHVGNHLFRVMKTLASDTDAV